MAPKPPSSNDPTVAAEDRAASELEKKLAAAPRVPERPQAGKPAAPAPVDDEDADDEEDDELDLDDDEEDEDLVVFTAKEAAGALATVYRFVRPFLKNYKKVLALVTLGVLVETLFNV